MIEVRWRQLPPIFPVLNVVKLELMEQMEGAYGLLRQAIERAADTYSRGLWPLTNASDDGTIIVH